MPYDHLEEAHKARAAVLTGHRRSSSVSRKVASTSRVSLGRSELLGDLGRLVRRIPEYQRDGTQQMLEGWIDAGLKGRQMARSFIDRC